MRTKLAAVKGMHLEGKLEVAGYNQLPVEMPSNLLEDPPLPSKLCVLKTVSVKKTGGETETKIAFPDDILSLWHNSGHGEEFSKVLEAFHEEFGVNVDTANNKRSLDGDAGPSPKKPRADQTTILIEDLPSGDLVSVACQQKGTQELSLKVYTGNVVYLVNESAAPVTVPDGSTIAGMGKGKFEVDSDKTASKIFLYHLKDLHLSHLQGLQCK